MILSNKGLGLSLVQGIYFFLTGAWPLIHTKSFEWVTGPKTDLWLVHAIGVLVMIIGGVLVLAAFRRKLPLEVKVLGIGCALGLMGIDIFYVWTQKISKIYLLDALAEFVFVLGWISSSSRFRCND